MTTEETADQAKAGQDPAFGAYVHWPFCARLCPYCDFNIYLDKTGQSADLLEAILADLDAQHGLFDPLGPVASVYFGGGTPSLLAPKAIGRLLERIDSLWGMAPGAEITLEANPDLAQADAFAGFATAGVGRLSLGVQALDDAALRQLGRTHDTAQALRAIDLAQAHFAHVSVDLIYARRGQLLEAWARELDKALRLGPGHFSLYELTIEPQTAFGVQVADRRWTPPDEDVRADFFEATHQLAASSGFAGYEVSNFARTSKDRSRHNANYWAAGHWLGVGPGAHGRMPRAGARWETRARARPADYIAALRPQPPGQRLGDLPLGGLELLEPMDESQVLRERLLMGLRPSQGMPAPDSLLLARQRALAQMAASLAQEGLLTITGARWAVAPGARALTDGIAARLALSVD